METDDDALTEQKDNALEPDLRVFRGCLRTKTYLSSRTIGCVMAHAKTRPARGEPTQQKSAHGGGNLDRSVVARFLAFTRCI